MIYTTRSILRLYRKHNVLYKRFNYVCASTNANENDKNNQKEDFQSLLQRYKEKIRFNSYLEHEKLQLGHFKYYLKTLKRAKESLAKEQKIKSLPPLPVALQYYVDKDRLLAEDTPVKQEESNSEVFQLPFSNVTNVEITHNKDDQFQSSPSDNVASDNEAEFDRSNIKKWMTNYEHFDDTRLEEESDDESTEWVKQYGTPDPTINVSNVPCGGCGALLHCSDPSIPGYLPSELFSGRSQMELKKTECQRCHFLKQYNIALDVTVEPEEYEKLLQSIRYVKSLVLLMVDLLDYPCSIWPGIVDIIGTDRPIIVVGNKVDLLPGDSIGYLNRVKMSLIEEIKKTKLGTANIKYIGLISAKTGYGVEDLISFMFKTWLYKGDVFLVGCTNVGKSSLFNALLQSDYCKVHATDIVKRATVSRWPGTTLHLLKFPINRPSGWKIYQRTRRLKAEAKLMKVEKEIRKAQLQGMTPKEPPTLMGHIGRSFSEEYIQNTEVAEKLRKLMVIDEKHFLFAKSKWFYDTPGVMHPDQVLSLLSTEELLLTLPKKVIRPQTYYLHKGSTIFIGGLARVDVLRTDHPVRLTVFCSEGLPITVTDTDHADEVYEAFLGTELFAVPSGGAERLQHWPGLKKGSEDFEFVGEGPKVCCGDVVLSSAAWVSVTAKGETRCTLRGWTVAGRGLHRRCPSILPYAVNLKGKRLQDTPAYMVGKVFTGDP
ncbi:nitric oxide-associated protein 1 [Amyelois transitella]|uniref:nitric oxide-associated protein 1 n=1 Tax=Amyelois transitella TaxID=680683 RepID=UPI0029905B5A|nr:nitric oxide-associated protein 1 [Amyelois transitella]